MCCILYCAVWLYGCMALYGAVWRCIAVLLYTGRGTTRLCCIAQYSRFFWCIARRAGCIGWPAVLGGQGWPDDLVGASLSLAMLSWVPLTVCDVCSVTLTHPCSHVTMTTIGFVRRHSAHTAVLLYCGLYCNTAQNLLYWSIQPTIIVPRPLNSNTAIQRHTAQYSYTAIHHNTVYSTIHSPSGT